MWVIYRELGAFLLYAKKICSSLLRLDSSQISLAFDGAHKAKYLHAHLGVIPILILDV